MKPLFRRVVYSGLAALAIPLCTVMAVEQSSRDAALQGDVSQRWAAPGPMTVASFDLELVDTARPTSAHGSYRGAPSRTLKTTVWYPAAPRTLEALVPGPAPVSREGGPYPLVIYNHGFMSFREEGTYMANQLASHGYVVVAANFPLTNYFAPTAPTIIDVVNQPGDVSFLISTVLQWNQDKQSEFYGRIASDKIGVVGLSLGGMTTTLVGFHPTLKDPRVKTIVSMAGPIAMFEPRFFEGNSLPFLMIGGSLDVIVPYKAHAARVTEKDSNATLVTLQGATHVNFADIAGLLFRWSNNPEPQGCAQLTKNLHREDDFLGPLGGESVGISGMTDDALPCQTKEFPRALRPAFQHDLTRLVVHAWMDSLFGKSDSDRAQARQFLQETLPHENPQVIVSGHPVP